MRRCRQPRRIAWRRISQAALPLLPSIARTLAPGGRRAGAEYVARNPTRADRHPGSFSINLRSGLWSDFATGESGGDVVSFVAYCTGVSQAAAARELARLTGVDLYEP